jgi:hypothetical protein
MLDHMRAVDVVGAIVVERDSPDDIRMYYTRWYARRLFRRQDAEPAKSGSETREIGEQDRWRLVDVDPAIGHGLPTSNVELD